MKKAAKDLKVGDRIFHSSCNPLKDQPQIITVRAIQLHRPYMGCSIPSYGIEFEEIKGEWCAGSESVVEVETFKSPQGTYGELLAEVCPRVIKTEEEYDRLLAIAEKYTFQKSKTEEERDLYTLIVLLIEKYESRYFLPDGSIDWGDAKAYQAD